MKTISKRSNHKKTQRKKYQRGGNTERIEKLKNFVEFLLQFVYYNFCVSIMRKFIPKSDRSETHKTYTFEDYMTNNIPDIPRIDSGDLVGTINIYYNSNGVAYQLLPRELLSNQYIKDIDKMIKSMVDKNTIDITRISINFIEKLYLSNIITYKEDMIQDNIDRKLAEIYNIPLPVEDYP